MEIRFFLNLDWRRNKYRRLYGLHCNPFGQTSQETGRNALQSGIPKLLLQKYLSMLGLSTEVIRILEQATKPNRKYWVVVSNTSLRLQEAS